jgi:hypothetical protein
MGESNSVGRKTSIWKILACGSMVLDKFCIMKSLEYPLMATSLSKARCNRIMKPIQAAGLLALGINCHLTLEVLFGPKQYQGVGIPGLWMIQGIPKLWLALQHHDEFLMTAFASHRYQDSQLTLLNLCRLSCHALRLSDISTGDGRRFLPRSWQGYPTDSSGCEFAWPYHGRP